MGIVETTLEDIKSMRIQGARSIALAGLKAIKELGKSEGFGKKFNKACNLLESSRPTAVALHNTLENVMKKKTLEEIDRMIYYFENVSSIIASQNYKLIKKNSIVLTHCHSSSVVEILSKAWEKKIDFDVIVTETRPVLQGKITARELSEDGIPVTYIVDSAAGLLIKDVDMMIVGCDAIRKEGIVNKIGTYPLAVLSKGNGIPVYFVGEILKIDKRKKIVIEERNSNEVIRQRELPKVKIRNPAFDITPWKYIDGVLTEKGIFNLRKIQRMFR